MPRFGKCPLSPGLQFPIAPVPRPERCLSCCWFEEHGRSGLGLCDLIRRKNRNKPSYFTDARTSHGAEPDGFSSDAPGPFEIADYDDFLAVLDEVLDTLTTRERKVIAGCFGLGTGREIPMRKIGDMLGLSRQRIFQLREKALRKLRHPTRLRRLEEFLQLGSGFFGIWFLEPKRNTRNVSQND